MKLDELSRILREKDPAAVLVDRPGEPALGAQLDDGFADDVVGCALEGVGVEGRGVADRMRH